MHQIFSKTSTILFQDFTKFFSKFHQIFLKISPHIFIKISPRFSPELLNFPQNFNFFFKISPMYSQNFINFLVKLYQTVLKISPNFSQNFTKLFSKFNQIFSKFFSKFYTKLHPFSFKISPTCSQKFTNNTCSSINNLWELFVFFGTDWGGVGANLLLGFCHKKNFGNIIFVLKKI